MEIRGKAAVITGAASGIGKAAAQELAKQGIKMLALVDLSDELTNLTNIIVRRTSRLQHQMLSR